MKTVIFILLILSFFFPFGGTFIVLQIQKKIVKEEIKHRIIEGIDKDELVLLSFTASESEEMLIWKESKEFEYNGDMYDIVDTDSGRDTITYWCWQDRAETKLNKRLNDQANNTAEQNPWNRENFKRISSLLQALFLPSGSDINSPGDSRIAPRFADKYIYSSVVIPPPIPPP